MRGRGARAWPRGRDRRGCPRARPPGRRSGNCRHRGSDRNRCSAGPAWRRHPPGESFPAGFRSGREDRVRPRSAAAAPRGRCRPTPRRYPSR